MNIVCRQWPYRGAVIVRFGGEITGDGSGAVFICDIGFESRWSAKEQLDENRDLKSENKAHHPLDDG